MENRRMSNRWKVLGIFLGIGMLILILGIDNKLTTVTYKIDSDQIDHPVIVALVSDFHSCDYGEGQEEIVNALTLVDPDVVLLTGDIVDDHLGWENAEELLGIIASTYPCYYVSGNHEFWSGNIGGIKRMIESYGVTILSGDEAIITMGTDRLQLLGVDDPDVGEGQWQRQIRAVNESVEEDFYTILLSHRPERVETYSKMSVDLIVAGHAHGGQWRIPGLLNGLLAPDQGLFPKYAGGLYDLESNKMLVSRGLARETTRVPRLFNPPELVVVTIE